MDGIIDNAKSRYAAVRSTGVFSVRLTDGFWKKKIDQCKDRTVPHLKRLFDNPKGVGCIHNLEVKAGIKQGEYYGTPWQDEFLYKWIESVCYLYAQYGDEALLKPLDDIIELIAKAQDPDGYMATQILKFKERFANPHNHELYNMGHLITAACAHSRITGKKNMLDIALKCADFLHLFFMRRLPRYANFCINPSIIMACVELHRVTGKKKYLDLANCFIDMRGSAPKSKFQKARDLNESASVSKGAAVYLEDLPPEERPIPSTPKSKEEGSDLNQTRVPLRNETEVVGHSVFWSYLYAGAADTYMESGDETLLKPLNRLWIDVTDKKLYVTGGAAAMHNGLSIRGDDVHEAVGAAYDLPNSTAYNETCSQIGNFMWNYRMFLLNGEAKHLDVMENEIYNSIISGISLTGDSWFYTNPLRWYGKDHKLLSQDAYERFQPGFRHICCPSNLLRTVAGFNSYMYAVDSTTLYLLQYGSSTFNGELAGGKKVIVSQKSDYPWDGKISCTVETEGPLTVAFRIPAWAEIIKLSVNGKPVKSTVKPGQFLYVKRSWKKGDSITLTLPMPVRFIRANPKIESAVNQIAVARGPLVYCLEGVDLPKKVALSQIRIPRNAKITEVKDKKLGVTALVVDALVDTDEITDGTAYRTAKFKPMKKIRVKMIPYFAWANRGVTTMTVYLPIA